MKKILILNGNPKIGSFCQALAEQYAAACRPSSAVQLVHVHQLQFDPDLNTGDLKTPPLEPDLLQFQQQLQWADHVVVMCPVWWGGMPAKLKGLFDRTLLSGFAFEYHQGDTFQRKLLKGRSAELFITLDTPVFWYRWWQKAPLSFQLKYTILGFVGINTQAIHYMGSVIGSDARQRQQWLEHAAKRGRRATTSIRG